MASASDRARAYVREHPFATTLSLWGGILAGTGIYLYKRQIPTQLKIIQARILAQAGLIVGAVSLGMVGWLASGDEPKVPAASSWKLRDFTPPPTDLARARELHHHAVVARDAGMEASAVPALAPAPAMELK